MESRWVTLVTLRSLQGLIPRELIAGVGWERLVAVLADGCRPL